MAQFSTVLYIVRHGERMDNVDKNWLKTCQSLGYDPYDPPLTDKGILQAAATGRFIEDDNYSNNSKSNIPITHVFTSPFLRCVETASQIVSALPLSQAFPLTKTAEARTQELLNSSHAKSQPIPTKNHNNLHGHSLSLSFTNITLSTFLNSLPGQRKRNKSAVVNIAQELSHSYPEKGKDDKTLGRSSSSITPMNQVSPQRLSSSSKWQQLPLGLLSFSIDNGLCEWLAPWYFPKPYPALDPNIRKEKFPYLTTEADLLNLRALAIGSNESESASVSTTIPISQFWPRYPESGHAMQSRFVSTAARLVDKYGWNSALVLVTHGNGVAAMVEALCRDVEVIETNYCCVTKLVRRRGEHRWRLEKLAYDGHIQQMEKQMAKEEAYNKRFWDKSGEDSELDLFIPKMEFDDLGQNANLQFVP
ncbi:hypothetical protein HK098_004394 [Nowakowskiella sp. JEL0407]|nr:hypothetical protein HK098_004394 [Nowakowskiella sp. JEL0407]